MKRKGMAVLKPGKRNYDAKSQSEIELKLREKVEELSVLHEISKSIISTLNLNEVLNLIATKAAHIMNAKVCTLRLLCENENELVLKASYGLSKEYLRKKKNLKVGESIAGKAVQKGKPYMVGDLLNDRRYKYPEFPKKMGLHSLLSVPLVEKEKIIGVLSIYSPESHFYKDDHIELLSMFASQVTIAIENAKLYKSLRDVYMHTITTLASIIDAKDHYTKSHSENVTKYAVVIAKKMGLSKFEIEDIIKACRLHDVGKIGVHDYILSKPGKLTEEEWKEVKMHSAKGAEILKPLTFLNGIIDLVRQHHERYDGTGYPDGLKGESIELGARIMAVADAFDAMVSERPYRKALPREVAVKELKDNIGTQFDPEVVKAFLKVLDKAHKKNKSK